MTKRRKLPAPPLVLDQYVARLPEQSGQRERLLRLADFLRHHGLLTDGGQKSLGVGLVGRNEVVSLGLQDIRSCAHSLAVSLWDCGQPDSWEEMAEAYFRTYDRGKPRRPTHLQRLYLEWSRSRDWLGLLRVVGGHEFLWDEIHLALERLEDPDPDKDCLLLAWACRHTIEPWLEAWRRGSISQKNLLKLLPYLDLTLAERLMVLEGLGPATEEHAEWVRACRCRSSDAANLRLELGLLRRLEARALKVLQGDRPEFLDPALVGAFRALVTRGETVEVLMAAVSVHDPLRQVVFGARPGRNWLEVLAEELAELIELRSESSQ